MAEPGERLAVFEGDLRSHEDTFVYNGREAKLSVLTTKYGDSLVPTVLCMSSAMESNDQAARDQFKVLKNAHPKLAHQNQQLCNNLTVTLIDA